MTLLVVDHLRVTFPPSAGRRIHAVDDVSFTVAAGEALALVGRSGSGKSLTAAALIGLIPPPGAVAAGSRVELEGVNLAGLSESAWERVRGRRIGMVFQDPAGSLDPVYRVRDQIMEAVRAIHRVGRRQAGQQADTLLREVGFPLDRAEAFPHQLSGGLKQRVGIAIALAGAPALLVADEPTSALDVTIQAQILALLHRLRHERQMGLLLITHDFGVVAELADRVAVIEEGRIVEEGSVRQIIDQPSHPRTRELLQAVPRLEGATG
jgi:ABC-type glutathione transport system ATPase component